MKKISILGSTGSIGQNSLNVIREHSDKFEVIALTCNNNIELLCKQIIEFNPKYISVGSYDLLQQLKKMLNEHGYNNHIEFNVGMDGLLEAASLDADTVINALMGMIGLKPTIVALKEGKRVALANKETLVAGGHIVASYLQKYKGEIIPVDSEHSAIFQCLLGNSKPKKLLLTASGGPFRTFSIEELKYVTLSDALKHPNWKMGKKITIDSATMMNKGLEVIEAMWLFDVNVEDIEILVHPQSIIHSMVEFDDGAIVAQLGSPDMKIPIALALSYPQRLSLTNNCDFFSIASQLTFERPDLHKFKCLQLALEAARDKEVMPAILNSANEELVHLFLNEKIGFNDIYRGLDQIMSTYPAYKANDVDDVYELDKDVRLEVSKLW